MEGQLVTLNNEETAFSDNTFFEVVDTVVFLAEEQYSYLDSLWTEGSIGEEKDLSEMVTACLSGMELLKDDLIAKLYDRYYVQEIFWKDKKYSHDLFVRVLELFEKFHTLRVKVGDYWRKNFSQDPDSNIHIIQAQENNFCAYANVLLANVDVKTYFERMRSTDIK